MLRHTNLYIPHIKMSSIHHPNSHKAFLVMIIDWVIVGGESGFKARPIKKEWIIEIKNQCKDQKIPFFFKQWGKPEFNPDTKDPTINSKHRNHAKGGCLLEGKLYRELPKIKRFPAKAA